MYIFRKVFLIAVNAGLGLILFGCKVGPDYKQPEIILPKDWSFSLAPQISNDYNNIEQTWWQNFHDPVLNQLIEKVAAGNMDIKIAKARIVQARAMWAYAKASLLPSGDLMAGTNRQSNQIGFPSGGNSSISQLVKQPFNVFKTGFDASWELDLFGGHRRDAESANADFEASMFSRDDMLVSTVAEVARTYVEIRQYQAQLSLAEQILAADQKQSAITQQRFDVGETSGVDVSHSIALQEQDLSHVSSYKNLLAQAEYSLDLFLGERPGIAQTLVKSAANIPQSDGILMLATPAAVITNRSDIRNAERKLVAATAQQGVALAKFFPDVSLAGFIGLFNTNAANFISVGSKSWLMGANILWPILSYGTLAANLDAADAKQQEALEIYQKSIISALSDVERSVTAYTEQEKYTQSLERADAAEQKARNIAFEYFNAGLTSYLDVLTAERKLLAAKNQLILAKSQTSQNLIAVYKSLGGGWKGYVANFSESKSQLPPDRITLLKP